METLAQGFESVPESGTPLEMTVKTEALTVKVIGSWMTD
jgi:hypothetical protein